ncbi:hypothetical protein F0562_011087 [Nyssa sinensis]|uniref:Ionotropic glutamate receptor C-terminal domain-containing protein n=1 Tax=Nyssa sinensis TaxID=561372 RepID=A0A5J5A378_9ASTE|nr:hypothetical protein F0562_011087 [Nyssa sinensis]
MAAMADLIDFYGWKEVIAIFVDDDYGRNGISALDDELTKKMSKISYKLPLPPQFDLSDIADMLNKTKLFGPRVYVLHLNPDPGGSWASSTYATNHPKKGLCVSVEKMQQNGLVHSELNAYGLYAYDTVWAVAHSIDKFLNEHGNITFSVNDKLHDMEASEMQLGKLRVFDGGKLLLKILSQINFTGLTGRVHFNADKNLVCGGYDVINIAQMAIRRVGYWSNNSGLSVLPPETLKAEQISYSHLDQKLENVIWPGRKTEKPRGWELANDERPLRIGVPKTASFIEFVTELNNSHNVQGYCIDVFIEAQKLVPYDVPYRFEPFGDGRSNPSYDELVRMVSDNVFDAAVGDIAIVTNRTKIVDFTQPYAATGLVIVAPISNSKSSAWVFLKPFTVELWCVTAASFVIIAIVIWILEHHVNDAFRGPPRRQLTTMFLFSFSTLFKTNQEDTVSALGRMVMVTDFGIIGQPFTKNGWGFAFQRDSPLAIDVSTAILKLAKNGKLRQIREKWFCKTGCAADRRRVPEPDQLHLSSFWGYLDLCYMVIDIDFHYILISLGFWSDVLISILRNAWQHPGMLSVLVTKES